ncbi:MAG: hypothetical protein AAFP81_05505 [Pseudomonadota bacterium]
MTDSLKTLWQDTPPFDVDAMVARLNKNNRDMRSLNTWSSIASLAVFIVLVGLEWSGSLHTGGMMTILGTLCFIAAGTHYVLAKRKLQRAFSREPSALITFMIQRTKAAINLGRGLYLLPIPSLCAGYLLGRITPDTPSEAPMPDWIEPMVIVISLTFITVPTVIGIWFTRMKQRELKELQALATDLDPTK